MKKRTKILVCVIAGVFLLAVALCLLCLSHTAGFYTEKQHLARIQSRAERRYLGEGSEYTGLTVYPLYNEEDEFEHILIEFEPQGYLYVRINAFEFPWAHRMYTMFATGPDQCWYPYVYEKGATSEVEGIIHDDIRLFQDEEGNDIRYYVSHYKAAGIGDERRYLIEVRNADGSRDYMPAVKRGDVYLNLVSGKEIPCTTDFDDSSLRGTIEGDLDIQFYATAGNAI